MTPGITATTAVPGTTAITVLGTAACTTVTMFRIGMAADVSTLRILDVLSTIAQLCMVTTSAAIATARYVPPAITRRVMSNLRRLAVIVPTAPLTIAHRLAAHVAAVSVAVEVAASVADVLPVADVRSAAGDKLTHFPLFVESIIKKRL